MLDLGRRLLPIEVKSGMTVPSDAFAGLDWFCDLAGEPGGVLITGGDEAYLRGRHVVQTWRGVS